MSSLLIGLLGALLTTNQPAALSNLVVESTGISVAVPGSSDPLEREFQKLSDEADAAQEETGKWFAENEEAKAAGEGVSDKELNRRIRLRIDPLRAAYEDFIKHHPNHARARASYASFLRELNDEEGAQAQLEAALRLDTNNPAIYNDLAEIYAHVGPIKTALKYFARAIELNPREPLYYHNFADVVYLFRTDVKELYGINEQQVFDKALDLYRQAMKLDPANFDLAYDVAQTYYGIQPRRTEAALNAWTNALSIAPGETERESVYVHLARLKLHDRRFAEARAHLDSVTNEMYDQIKKRLTRNLEALEQEARETNAPTRAVTEKKK
jgi:tetratricopeptide (TPR) repeat protein